MNKEQVLKKYKDICEQAIFVAQRCRSFRHEIDDFRDRRTGESIQPEGAMYFGPVLEQLDVHLYRDTTDLNTLKVFDILSGKCTDGTFTCSDAVTCVTLIAAGPVLSMAYELFALMYEYDVPQVPSPLQASVECMKAGLEL